jgi:hypothetical protein
MAEQISHIYFPLVITNNTMPIPNGDFEQGKIAWTFDEYDGADVVNATHGLTPHSGNWMAKLPSGIPGLIPFIQQSVTIPDHSPYLAFWWSSIITECYIARRPSPVMMITAVYRQLALSQAVSL